MVYIHKKLSIYCLLFFLHINILALIFLLYLWELTCKSSKLYVHYLVCFWNLWLPILPVSIPLHYKNSLNGLWWLLYFILFICMIMTKILNWLKNLWYHLILHRLSWLCMYLHAQLDISLLTLVPDSARVALYSNRDCNYEYSPRVALLWYDLD